MTEIEIGGNLTSILVIFFSTLTAYLSGRGIINVKRKIDKACGK